ncbi:MAG: hypothetical protein JSU86_18905 [Phycisphaerales bacterium]|nr:MAG: hypothetical protein JSU86_18905 [Phycisphaerales bacterium]
MKGSARLAADRVMTYSWEVERPGQIRFFEDLDKLEAYMRHEGKYILKTDDPELTAVDTVAACRELSTVEWRFRDLKDVIEGRPIFHQRDQRVEAHEWCRSWAYCLGSQGRRDFWRWKLAVSRGERECCRRAVKTATEITGYLEYLCRRGRTGTELPFLADQACS